MSEAMSLLAKICDRLDIIEREVQAIRHEQQRIGLAMGEQSVRCIRCRAQLDTLTEEGGE